MNVLVTGGAASGKSAFAEQLACALAPQRTYLATMARGGGETQARIERHRAQRAGLGFATIERPQGSLLPLPAAEPQVQGVVLLDDLGNLVANALFDAEGSMANPSAVLNRLDQELRDLFARPEHVVVVSDETGCEGRSPYEGTRIWVRLVGALSCRVAARADVVVEVAAGVPCVIKGDLP